MNERPPCPACTLGVTGLRGSYGVVAAYPCNDWLTPAQASTVRDQARAAREA